MSSKRLPRPPDAVVPVVPVVPLEFSPLEADLAQEVSALDDAAVHVKLLFLGAVA